MSNHDTDKIREKLNAITKELQDNSNSDKVPHLLVERAKLHEALHERDRALTDARDALQRNPTLVEAKNMIQRLSSTTEATQTIPKDEDSDLKHIQGHLARLENHDPNNVKTFVQSPDFVKVLQICGAEDSDASLRAAAVMILTRLFHPGPDSPKDYPMHAIIEACAKYVTNGINAGTIHSKIEAYHTLALLLQTSDTIGATILSQQSVIEEIMDTIEFEHVNVQLAIAEVLAIACSDASCRKAIMQFGGRWLAKVASARSSNERLATVAATTLTKLRMYASMSTASQPENAPEDLLEEEMKALSLSDDMLVTQSMTTITSSRGDKDATLILQATEGLAYASVQPKVKQRMIKDDAFLERLVSLVTEPTSEPNHPLIFGIATIFDHLTAYLPVLTEQQRQMQRLQNLANAKRNKKPGNKSGNDEDDPLDQNEAVDKRIQCCIRRGVCHALVAMARIKSANIQTISAKLAHQLLTPTSSRGALIQQGIVKALMPLLSVKDTACSLTAAQALAKIAITTNPNLVFGNQMLSLVQPFLSLLKSDRQLQQFEGMMALTNLASLDDQVRLRMFKDGAMETIEGLLLSSNDLVQRAATELLCNMTFCEPVFELYSDSSKSQNRIRLLMILTDCEDVGTRRAASGALAILANSKGACEMMTRVDRGYERIARLLSKEEPPDVHHRAVEIIRCIVEQLPESKTPFLDLSVDKSLQNISKTTTVPVVKEATVDVYRLFHPAK